MVHFKKEVTTFFTLKSKHNKLDNVIIKWEKFDFSKKKNSQCKNCQLYGHVARNCGRAYRCIKCIETHLPGQCNNINEETEATCVNCSNHHPANSKSCPYYLKHIKNIENARKNKPKVKNISLNKEFLSNNNFPPLSKNNLNLDNRNNLSYVNQNSSTFSNILTGKNVNLNESSFLNFSSLNNEFNSISDIKITLSLYKELINKLKSTNCHKTRLSFIIEYTTP
jgi:hypothetical protein